MVYWIFVISDTEAEFKKRMEKKVWPIFSFTANRQKLKEGDGIVFYQAGIGGQKFLGQAEVASKIKKDEGKIDYFVGVKYVKVWKNHVEMHPLINSLDFIGVCVDCCRNCCVLFLGRIIATIFKFSIYNADG